MAAAGFRPSSIITMVASHGEAGGKGTRIGRLLPRGLRIRYAGKVQEIRRMFWPRQIRKQHPELYEAIAEGMSSVIDEPRKKLDAMTGDFRWESYSDDVRRVLVRDYHDPAVLESIEGVQAAPVLYTGGGLVPPSLIGSSARFLHVHPGNLPHVRGADGLLWSTLVRGRPGAACFYMNEGIDTGEIIEATDLAAMTFEIAGADRPDDQTLYRAIFSYYDPMMRATLFSKVLKRFGGHMPESGSVQSANAGMTYHFMHPQLRARVLRRIFIS
jgi:hypothetical protein